MTLSKKPHRKLKTTQFKGQCKGQTYKTAEIVLLCHQVMGLFVHWTLYMRALTKNTESELSLQVWLVFVIVHL